MEYIIYKKAAEADCFTAEHAAIINGFIEDFEKSSTIKPTEEFRNIEDVSIDELSLDELNQMIFHFTPKNNGASIEQSGLVAQIGDNSANIDRHKAIYFSIGGVNVLRNINIWLKWRINRFNNPIATGVKNPYILDYPEKHNELALRWMDLVSTRKYLDYPSLIEPALHYERINMSRSDYLILEIEKGKDFPETQFDRKKSPIKYVDYAQEIYDCKIGSTDIGNDFAEDWNRFTTPGKDATIPFSKIKRAVTSEGNDALSVIRAIFKKQQVEGERIDFDLLSNFLS